MQENNLNITIGPVNHIGVGFKVDLHKGRSKPQYMGTCKFCHKNISFHVHQEIPSREVDSFLCRKCGRMHNKVETRGLINNARWVSPTCKFYIDNYKPYMQPSMISVRVIRWQEFKGVKLTGDTVVELPKCTGYSASYEGIRTAESFDKWVTIQVSPNKKPNLNELLKKAAEQIKAFGYAMANAAPITPLDEAIRFKLTFDERTSSNVKTNAADLVEVKNEQGEVIGLSIGYKISNDDGDFTEAGLSEGKELCHAAKTLENALTTLSIAKDTEDDFLITCAELAVEESRDQVAHWIELFEKNVEQHK